MLILGIVAKIEAQKYFNLSADGAAFSKIPLLLIGVGVFVTVIGIVGSIGAMFAGYTPGRVLLMVVRMLYLSSKMMHWILPRLKSDSEFIYLSCHSMLWC